MSDDKQFEIDPAELIDAAEAETLSGDLRDALLTHVRSIKVPWAMLSEIEQQETIDAIDESAVYAVRNAVAIIAQAGAPHVHAKICRWVVKSGDLKLELSVTPLVENMIALAEHGSRSAVLVLADPNSFVGEREKAKADPDQPQLPIDKAA